METSGERLQNGTHIIHETSALDSTTPYAAPVWSSTSLTNYHHLQVYQSKCLRVIGNFPRRTPITNLHAHLQMIPILQFIYLLTDKLFMSCPAHPNTLVRNTGNSTTEDLHRQYTKYIHKRIKHIRNSLTHVHPDVAVFFLIHS